MPDQETHVRPLTEVEQDESLRPSERQANSGCLADMSRVDGGRVVSALCCA